jgi:hypothetical protein
MTVHSRSRVPTRADGWHATSEGAWTTARPARRLDHHVQLLEMVLIAGLAGVFIVNAIVAWLQPSDFTVLIERSVVGRQIPAMSGRWIAWVIAVHDFIIGVVLLASMWIVRWRPSVLAWAGAWLLLVTVVKLTALNAFGG